MTTKAVVAVARELSGFVWAIGRQVQIEQQNQLAAISGSPA
jgi:hypothetical protein